MKHGECYKLLIWAVTVLLICLVVISANAQEIEFASSPNPVGSGARALGMGGAFIAVADDATAASWNPGGLIQLELPEISLVGWGYSRSEDNAFTFDDQPASDSSPSSSEVHLNYLSVAYPFTLLDRNMIVAATYQHLYDFNRSFKYHVAYEDSIFKADRSFDYDQEGGLSAIGLSYAIQIIPALSLGVTMNVWEDGIGYNSWTQEDNRTEFLTINNMFNVHQTYHIKDEYSFEGVNFNFGFMWRVNESLTLGGVFKTPFTANITHDHFLSGVATLEGAGFTFQGFENADEVFDEEMDMPASYGMGVSYRFSDEFTAAFDIYRTHWEDMIYNKHDGVGISAISAVEESESDIDATVQLRTGVEYLVIKEKYIIPLRAGLFYDPAPAEGSSDDFYGFTLGSGLAWKKYVFDAGYQFRFGNDVGSSLAKSINFDLSQDVREHTLYASLIVHF